MMDNFQEMIDRRISVIAKAVAEIELKVERNHHMAPEGTNVLRCVLPADFLSLGLLWSAMTMLSGIRNEIKEDDNGKQDLH